MERDPHPSPRSAQYSLKFPTQPIHIRLWITRRPLLFQSYSSWPSSNKGPHLQYPHKIYHMGNLCCGQFLCGTCQIPRSMKLLLDPGYVWILNCRHIQNYPTHCNIPDIFEENQTLMEDECIMHATEQTIPASTTTKSKHAKILRQLTNIIANQPPLRVNGFPTTRVGKKLSYNNTNTMRVDKKVIKTHQYHIPINTPTTTIID